MQSQSYSRLALKNAAHPTNVRIIPQNESPIRPIIQFPKTKIQITIKTILITSKQSRRLNKD